jgi:hypothetical protein
VDTAALDPGVAQGSALVTRPSRSKIDGSGCKAGSDRKAPGITMHPLPLMNGWTDPHPDFFDNVIVPAGNLVTSSRQASRSGRGPAA